MTTTKKDGKVSKSGTTKQSPASKIADAVAKETRLSTKKAKATKTKPAPQGDVFVGSISKIGWENENPTFEVICIDKATRDGIRVVHNSVVKVKKAGTDTIKLALVARQFKEFVGQSKVSVNTKLATGLGLTATDKVEITGRGLLESEASEFRATIMEAIRTTMRTTLRPIGDSDSDEGV